MLVAVGMATDDAAAEARVRNAIASGAGLEVFRALIEAQDGDPAVIDDYGRLPHVDHREPWLAPRSGFVSALDAELVGRAAVVLGAGRDRADATVDPAVGIDIVAPVGARVERNDPVLMISCAAADRIAAARALLDRAVETADAPPAARPLVIGTVS
jgi:thymidine phosphorylase